MRRRRRCPGCDKRFTTYERAELTLPAVVKKNGTRVEFDRSKLRSSMTLALRKRPVSAESIEAAISRIEEALISSGAREAPSDRIGELVMRELRRLDKVGYVRFASVYRNFEHLDEFAEIIQVVRPDGVNAR